MHPTMHRPGQLKTGGRPKGVPNRSTRAVREAVAPHLKLAVETLASLCVFGHHESIRLKAARALLRAAGPLGSGHVDSVLAGLLAAAGRKRDG